MPKSAVMAVVKPGCPACELAKPELARARIPKINADTDPQLVEKLGVEAFPDIVYTNSRGAVHHMPWPSKGQPKAADIVRWTNSVRGGHTPLPQQTRKTQCARCGPDGVAPSVWGPPVWFAIHMVALMYPSRPTASQKREAKDFFHGLQRVLPCSYCQKHFAKELATIDPKVFASRDALFAWTVAFHDSVSDRTHSTQPRRSVQEWRDHYKRIALRSTKKA